MEKAKELIIKLDVNSEEWKAHLARIEEKLAKRYKGDEQDRHCAPGVNPGIYHKNISKLPPK